MTKHYLVVYFTHKSTNILSTTSLPFSFSSVYRSGKCDAAIIVTASHLPEDKNGIKFFSSKGGLDKKDIDELVVLAQEEATQWYNIGLMPPSSGNAGVLCSELVSLTCMWTFLLLFYHYIGSIMWHYVPILQL
jgi:hypothetical protein